MRIAVFLVGTLMIALLSRRSLAHPHSHGFYRFFACELVLILIILNVDFWFADPLSFHQCVSWFLLFLSIIPAVWGFRLLSAVGKPERISVPQTQLAFENTTTLVTIGIYRYIRHPMYASLLLLGWGVFFKSPSLLGGAIATGITAFLTATAKVEEAENLKRFGSAYARYIAHTRMFIPLIF